MPRVPNDVHAAGREQLSTLIRQCYNRVVTTNAPSAVQLEPHELWFSLSVDSKTSRFEAEIGRSPERGRETVYAASFDFLTGMNGRLADASLAPDVESAVRFVHEELGRIFERLTTILIGQLDKR